MDQTTIAGGMDSLAGSDEATSWSLTVVHHADGSRLGATYRVSDAGILLGREGHELGHDIFKDGRVSRRHAQLTLESDTLTLTDLDSRNGTYLNGSRIEKSALEVGDVIGLGTVMVICHRVPASFTPVSDNSLAGAGPAHAALVRAIAAVATRETPVLLRGETGSGRDRVAVELHHRSGRSGAFVPVHCGAVSSGKPREELFGAGGLVERAEAGTLYLDGFDDASVEMQVSLLRLLETGDAAKGTAGPHNLRILASTDARLDQLVARGSLREDFAARFGRYEIALAPLRQHLEDVPLLAASFVEKFTGAAVELDFKLSLRLLRYDWPGNVRELESVIERAVIDAGDAERLTVTPAVDGLLARGESAEPDSEAPFELSSRDNIKAPLQVAANGMWFELTGTERVDLENRRALPLLLEALIEARAQQTGLAVAELVLRGWPDERIIEEAGANRVYVALTTLRKLGLRDFIVRNRQGYCLDPECDIRVV